MTPEIPVKLRPYLFHKIALRSPVNHEAVGDCPFCGRENKFSVNSTTGMWKCWVCAKGSDKGGGNVYTFIKEFHALCMDATKPEDFRELADTLGLLESTSLVEWQIVKSVTTGEWLVPGYNPEFHLVTLYRMIKQQDGSVRAIPTPTLGHQLQGLNFWDAAKPIVYVCEGWKDAITLWEILTKVKNSEDHKMVETASRDHSLYAQANVIAIPGAEVFFDHWVPLLQGRVVNLMYDSDHPRKGSGGRTIMGAGITGVKRVAELLSSSKYQPQEINWIEWGPEGYDPQYKSGYDVRDYLTRGGL